jgi:hypothetical protein
VLAILSGCVEQAIADTTKSRNESATATSHIVRGDTKKAPPPPISPLQTGVGNTINDATSPALSGRITLPGGAPAHGARVQLLRRDLFGPPFYAPSAEGRETSAGVDGSFRLTVDREPVYVVRVTRPGYASVRCVVEGFQPGFTPSARDLTINLEMTTASRVSGRIVNEKGDGVEGVSLTAQVPLSGTGRRNNAGQFDASGTTSTFDGRFAFEDAPPFPLILSAESQEFVPRSVSVTPPAGDIQIRLAREGAAIYGNVFLEAIGEGVSSATVRLTLSGPDDPRWMPIVREAQTDHLGGFRFDRLPAANASLDVSRGDHLRLLPLRHGAYRFFPIREKETTTGIGLPLYTGHTVKGTITDAISGEPVEGVEIVRETRGTAPDSSLRQTSPTLSDLSGHYQINHAFPTWGSMFPISVRKDGYMMALRPGFDSQPRHVNLPPDELTVVHNIAMIRAISISGRVQNRRGEPVAGAKLTFHVPHPWGYMENPATPVSNRDGSFKLWASPFCTARLVAEAAGMARGLSDEFEVMDKPVECVLITVPPGASIAGTVLDPDGKPVEGAQIQVRTVGADLRIGSTGFILGDDNAVKSDADGAFTIVELPECRTFLSARKSGFAGAAPVEIVAAEGENRDGVVIRMDRGFSISGKVTDAEGNPVPDANVTARGMGPEQQRTRQTDTTGSYRIEALAGGVYNVNAYDKTGRLESGEITGVETGRTDADIVLTTASTHVHRKPRMAIFTGTVIDWKTGQPVRDFTVQCRNYRVRRLEEAGKFEIANLPVGETLKLIIDAPDYHTLESESISIPDEQPIEKTFQLGPGGTIVGRTIRTGGEGAFSGIRVKFCAAESEANRKHRPTAAAAVTGTDGRFRLEHVPASKGFVSFYEPGMLTDAFREVLPEHGCETDLGDIVISTERGIDGRVVRQPGTVPIPDVLVDVSEQSANISTNTRTAADGTFSFRGIGVGEFHVTLPDMNVNTFIRTGREPTAGALFEVGEAELAGHISRRGKGEQGTVSLSRQIQGHPDVHTFAHSDPDGAYRIPNLAPGDWNVGASSLSGEGQIQERVSMPATGIVQKDFALPGGLLTGMVEDRDGRPVGQAEIVVQPIRTKQNQKEPGYHGRTLWSGSDGRFRIEGIKEGEYQVSAIRSGAGIARTVVSIPADSNSAPVNLRLGVGGGSLVSIALGAPDRKPLPQATLSLVDSQTARWYTHKRKRDDRGLVRVDGLPAGKYQVNVGADGYGSTGRPVTIEDGKTATVETVLGEAESIR